jgi:hypothetical protein
VVEVVVENDHPIQFEVKLARKREYISKFGYDGRRLREARASRIVCCPLSKDALRQTASGYEEPCPRWRARR